VSPTPDERRASWVEPGLAKRVEDGEVKSVAIDLNRVQTYSGNGMTILGFPVISAGPSPRTTPHLVLTPQAIRRLARIVDPPSPQSEDHEASIEAAIRAFNETTHPGGVAYRKGIEAAIAAYLSPERDPQAEE